MRYWSVGVTAKVALLATLLSAPPTVAEIVRIDPSAPPPTTLAPDEVARMNALQNAEFPFLFSDLSPDGRRLVAWTSLGWTVFDFSAGTKTPLALDVNLGFSSFRWRDAGTLVTIATDFVNQTFHRLSVSALTGAQTLEPLNLDGGFPVSLSTRGRKLLFVRFDFDEPAARRGPTVSPMTKVQRPEFRRVGPVVWDPRLAGEVLVATATVDLLVLDLDTGREEAILTLPLDTGIASIGWSRSERQLAFVRSAFSDSRRGGVVPVDSPTVLDGLGLLPPAKNPFFTSNALDLFDLGDDGVRHKVLRPGPPGGEIFTAVSWSPDGSRLLATTGVPSHPKGRSHPTYLQYNAARHRLYSRSGRLLAHVDRPELSAPASVVHFLSGDDVVFHTVHGLNWGLFHYDLRRGRLRRLPTGDGSIFASVSAPATGQIVYSHASILSPFELYRVGTDGRRAQPLTRLNASAAAANKVRVDSVSFDLGRDGERKGLLIQPAGAAFPPRNVPIVVWQQGGPTSTMTNDWGGWPEQPFNLLPNFGIAVLVVPLQGRLGFGAESFDALPARRNFGQVDVDEQAEIVKQLVRRGYAAPGRVGLSGCSYGGYFTSQSIVRHPGLYAAANPQCSLLNLVDEWANGYTGYIGYLEGRSPVTDAAEYRRDSPVFHGAAVTTPTLLFSATQDFLPWGFSGAFHDGIESAGTPARFLLFERDFHGLSHPSNRFVAAEEQLLWFRRYLGRR